MCVIIHKPAGKQISLETLRQCFRKNSDGAGIAYYNDEGMPVVEKGIMQADALLNRMTQLPADLDMIIHFRIKTSGKATPAQTHPFLINKDVNQAKLGNPTADDSLLFHNGIITGLGNVEISDTTELCSSILPYIPDLSARIKLLKAVGGKFALMDGGNIYTVGLFHEVDGCFFSNLHWQPTSVIVAGCGAWQGVCFQDDCDDTPYYGPYGHQYADKWARKHEARQIERKIERKIKRKKCLLKNRFD